MMRKARFRLQINEEIREADIVVGTKAQWESSSLAAAPGWSVNIQRGYIVGVRLVRGQTYHALSIKGGGAGSDLAIQQYGGDSSGLNGMETGVESYHGRP